MIRAVGPWACGAVPRAGLWLTLVVVAALPAGALLAQDVLLPGFPPVSESGPPVASPAGLSADGGSRLLGQLEDGVEAPPAARGLGGFPACPRDVLTRLLADAVGGDDALSVLAIEREMLKLCHERQKVIADIYQMEAKLEELRALPGEEAEPGAGEPDVVGAASVLLSRLGGETAGGAAAPEPSKTKRPAAPSYVWFSIIGGGDDLRAGVTDGSRVWFVRVGDPLPGAGRVERIGARPPGVWIVGAEDAVLLYGSAPGAGATP